MRKINVMNKKVLWISIASVATLGIGGFFLWRHFKNKKQTQPLEEAVLEEVTAEDEQETVDETKAVTGEQKPLLILILRKMWYIYPLNGVPLAKRIKIRLMHYLQNIKKR